MKSSPSTGSITVLFCPSSSRGLIPDVSHLDLCVRLCELCPRVLPLCVDVFVFLSYFWSPWWRRHVAQVLPVFGKNVEVSLHFTWSVLLKISALDWDYKSPATSVVLQNSVLLWSSANVLWATKLNINGGDNDSINPQKMLRTCAELSFETRSKL